MENFFPTLLEDVRLERSLILLLSLTDEGIFKQVGLLDHEISILKNLALRKLTKQKKSFRE